MSEFIHVDVGVILETNEVFNNLTEADANQVIIEGMQNLFAELLVEHTSIEGSPLKAHLTSVGIVEPPSE